MLKSVVAENISVAYDTLTLIENLSFEIEQGKCLVVTGSNGSGKSSLLRCIAGLGKTAHGEIRFCFDSRWTSPSEMLRNSKAPGFCAPSTHLYTELTGFENLMFIAGLQGVERNRVEHLLSRIGLKRTSWAKPVGLYSSGMQQRLRLAASLVHSPELLIWDEPTATLDREGRALVDQLLADHLHTAGIAIVATNDSVEADAWGDLIVEIGSH